MTKPLPERDVVARATRSGRARLSSVDEKALASIGDENLKKVLGELLESTRLNQANFEELEQWFPVKVDHPERYGPGLRYRYCANAPENEGTKKGPGNFFAESVPAQNLYITVKNLEETDVSKYLAEWDESTTSLARGYVFVTQPGVSDVLLIYRVNGNAVLKEPAGKEKYYKIPATLLVLGKVPAAFDETIELTFYRTGDEGSGGGEEGSGASGFLYSYNASTANEDPGAGKLSLNSATFSGTTTTLRLSKTDGDANALSAFLANLDDSLGSPRGEVVIRKKGAPKAFAVLKITGSLTNNASWVSFPVSFVAGEGLGGGDELYLQFDRFGVESYSLLESEDVVEWKQESKTLRERIRGYYDGVNRILEMAAGEGEEASLKAFLRLYGGGSKTLARVAATVGAITKTIVDGEGRSSFPQLSAVGKVTHYGLVSALPGSPAVGDRCQYYGDKANGVVWDLVYDGEGTFPWKKIGGPPLLLTSENERETAAVGETYASLPTDPLSVTLALKGEYDIEAACSISTATVAEAAGARYGYSVGATAANNTWAAITYLEESRGDMRPLTTVSKKHRHTIAAALTKVEEKATPTGAFVAKIARRCIWIDPVRVG